MGGGGIVCGVRSDQYLIFALIETEFFYDMNAPQNISILHAYV